MLVLLGVGNTAPDAALSWMKAAVRLSQSSGSHELSACVAVRRTVYVTPLAPATRLSIVELTALTWLAAAIGNATGTSELSDEVETAKLAPALAVVGFATAYASTSTVSPALTENPVGMYTSTTLFPAPPGLTTSFWEYPWFEPSLTS